MRDQLLRLFNNDAHQSTYRYILLDMLGRVSELSYLYIRDLRDNLAAENIIPLARPELAYNLTICPHLICIAEPNETLNKKLLLDSLDQALHEKLFTKHYVCGWLASELPPTELAENLVKVGKSMGGLIDSSFLPFYEPFRMQLFDDTNAACPQWLINSLSALVSYSYIDVTNKLRVLEQNKEQQTWSDIFIADDAKYYQKEANTLYNLYFGWYEMNKKRGIELSGPDFIKVVRCYRKAWRIGLTNMTDKFAYVYDSLKYGELEQNAEINLAIKAAIADPGSLVKRLSLIDESSFLSLQFEK